MAPSLTEEILEVPLAATTGTNGANGKHSITENNHDGPVPAKKGKYNAIPGPLGLASASLEGKVALVTGADIFVSQAEKTIGRGIGREMALELGRRGAKVIVNYANSSESAEEAVAAIKATGTDAVCIKANVSDVDQIVSLFEQAKQAWGRIDIVCSNSGVVSFGHVKDVTPEEFDRVFGVNTRGQFFVAREAYRCLADGGRIVLTSSNTARDLSVARHSLYSGSKAAVDAFVRILAKDCGDRNITVNAVAPGGTVTDMFHAVSQHYIPGGEKYTAEERQRMAAHASPLHRNGYPEDIARVVAFLVSKEAEWVNGKVITLDGGAA